MQIKEFDDDEVSLQLSDDELATISNSLNEACYGLRVADFEAKMGANRSEVGQKLDEILNYYDKMKEEALSAALMRFSDRELRMIIGALKEVSERIPDWEFHTRMGAEPGEVDEILVELITVYSKMNKLGS